MKTRSIYRNIEHFASLISSAVSPSSGGRGDAFVMLLGDSIVRRAYSEQLYIYVDTMFESRNLGVIAYAKVSIVADAWQASKETSF